MKLGILSDLHLSRAGLTPPDNDADLYILAGDLARPAEAIAWARTLAKPALYVPGNHEFYGGSLPAVVRDLKRAAAGTNVTVLDNEQAVIDGVRFLGSTLWSDFLLDGEGAARERAMTQAQEMMFDFKRIRMEDEGDALFTPTHSATLFERNAAWLEEKLAQPWSGPTVVITHHAPSARSVAPRFAGSPLNGGFTSHLDRLVGAPAALWIHGHMHHSVDYELNGTRVVCNPRGYVTEGRNENPQFDIDFCVSIA
jgi:predicted phosphodiesterase